MKLAQCRNVGKAGNSAYAGRHDDVPGVHLAFFAICATKRDGPSTAPFIVATALEFGGCPVVELHGTGPGCLNRFSASISGASTGVRPPSGLAAG